MKRPCQNLSRRQREQTPLPFARYLLGRVLELFPAERVAVLWTCRKTHYSQLWPKVELWGVLKDARRYAGPFPIIAHPPLRTVGEVEVVQPAR